tara:strand:- start:166 stop:540 length:375 start_codon:yes stop_codon:yes gene_type:complete
MDRHNRNFTAFKAYVNIYDSIIEDVTDRFLNERAKLKAEKAAAKEKVEKWCMDNDALYHSDYKVRFDQKCGCSCGCSPGFRVIVNEQKVRGSGYTQLLWNRRGCRGPQDVFFDMNGSVRVMEKR